MLATTMKSIITGVLGGMLVVATTAGLLLIQGCVGSMVWNHVLRDLWPALPLVMWWQAVAVIWLLPWVMCRGSSS